MFDEYKKAHEYFYGKKNHFWDLGLDNIRNFLRELGSPENKLNIIQVAGTNGKGSVSAFLTGILIESGYKVGRYNSPVVFEERENITVNNIPMSEAAFIQQVNCMYRPMELSQDKGKLPTIFELETAMAINYFYEENCDIVVLEAGLGGEKDATNVSEKNVMSVITSISLDHVKYLGNTIEQIAGVKAGIIKKNSITVMGINNPAVTVLMENKVKMNNGRFVKVSKKDIIMENSSLKGQTFSYTASDGIKMSGLGIKLLGNHQTENAAIAIEAAKQLSAIYKNITDETVRKGLINTVWNGRFQVVSQNPIIIIDGAHNPDAVLRLKENIDKYLCGYNIVFIMGVFADKDYRSMINIMKPYMKRVIAVNARGERALSKEIIKSLIYEEHAEADAISDEQKNYIAEAQDYRQAVILAKEEAERYTQVNGKQTAIVAFGSLSYLKDLLEEV